MNNTGVSYEYENIEVKFVLFLSSLASFIAFILNLRYYRKENTIQDIELEVVDSAFEIGSDSESD